MSLNIGELVGFLRIDDSGVEEGLTRSQQRVEGFKGAAKLAGAAAGAAAGGALSSAMANAAEFETANAKLKAQFGEGTAMAGAAGTAAGALFANGYGESMGEVAEVTSSVGRNISAMWGASATEIEGVTAKVMSLSQAFDQDFNGVIRATDQLISTGLAPNADAALDLIAVGFQSGINDADDLLDSISEYSTEFRELGISGIEGFGLLSQGVKAGARDMDTVSDALKEHVIMVKAMAKPTTEAYATIGLSATDMQAKMAAGGQGAKDALTQTLDALRAVEDPVKRDAAAVGLFGTKAEDLQDALFALDVNTAADQFGEVAGAAGKVDAALSDTAANRVKVMERQLTTLGASLVTLPGPLGDVSTMIGAFGPAGITMAGSLAMIGSFIGPLLVKIVSMVAPLVTTAAQYVVLWARIAATVAMSVLRMIADILRWVVQTTVQGALAVARMTATGAAYVAQWALMAARSIVQAAIMATAWAVGIIVPAAGALLRMAIVAALYIAQWVIMAVGSMASAVAMAAAWFVALGPVGWIIAIIVGLVALIIANWDTVKTWTVNAWNAVVDAVKAAWAWIVGAVESGIETAKSILLWLALLPVLAAEWFGGLARSAIDKLGEFIVWLTGLPGRILSALGDLGSLLINAGIDLVRGLWDGIAGMGTWLYNQILGWVKSFVPGPILQFLGIASPSKFMKNEVGRWIPEGIGEGIIANAAAASDAARSVAFDTAAGARAGAMSGMSSGSMSGQLASARSTASGPSADDIATAVGDAVHGALDGARMEIDGRGVARVVNRANLTDRRRSIVAAI